LIRTLVTEEACEALSVVAQGPYVGLIVNPVLIDRMDPSLRELLTNRLLAEIDPPLRPKVRTRVAQVIDLTVRLEARNAMSSSSNDHASMGTER
jgi:hypothetical protein